MAKRKLSPLIQAITNYNLLDERDKTTLAEYIRSQTVRPKSAPAAAKKSSRKGAATPSIPNGAEPKDSVSGVPICVACGHQAEYMDHFKPSPGFHRFESSLKKKAKVVLPDNPEDFKFGATA